MGDAYLNLSTLVIDKTGTAADRIIAKAVKDEVTGWIFYQATINALDTESMIGAMVQYAPVKVQVQHLETIWISQLHKWKVDQVLRHLL